MDRLRLTFSEKMNRVPAVTWLHFFPAQEIRDTRWHGATTAEISLAAPLPPDTVVVVEVAGGMADAHKVQSRRGRRFPIATGPDIPAGRISGVLVMADSAVTRGVVEMYAVPPDTLEYFEQPILRRTETDRTGAYVLDWLPVPGGPWLLRAYADANGDLRPGEKEAQRLLPDTLSLAVDSQNVTAGVSTLYAPNTPGRLLVTTAAVDSLEQAVMGWTMTISEQDTGWVPAPPARANYAVLTPGVASPIDEVAPGETRLIVFVDVDGDSTFSGVAADTLAAHWRAPLPAYPDSVPGHFLEPWLISEGLSVAPGLEAAAQITLAGFTLTPWAPPVAPADSSLAPGVATTDSAATTPPVTSEKEAP